MKSSSSKSTNTHTNALEYLRQHYARPSFGEILESVRICDEISQVELARKMGISRQDLCNIEKGRTQVSIERAVKFSKVLGYGELSFVSYVVQDLMAKAGLDVEVSFSKKSG